MSTQANLKAAQTELAALQSELPRFEELLAHNESEAAQLRQQRADPTEQAAALSRVNVARELLDQHRADVANAETQVRTLEADLEQHRACERIRAIYKELDAAREPWAEDVLSTLNQFIRDAVRLGDARRHLMELHREAGHLRDQLTQEATDPSERAALIGQLGIAPPLPLLHDSPQSWLPHRLTAPLDAVPNRLVTNFETYVTTPHPNLDRLAIRAKAPKE